MHLFELEAAVDKATQVEEQQGNDLNGILCPYLGNQR
jgi:hypothetical protein